MLQDMRLRAGLALKGIVMGAADIVPGVSGGTMALILGIYNELISSIKRISFRQPIASINFAFFIPLFIGIGSAFLILSRGIHYLLVNQAGMTYAFFFGLILASARHVMREVKDVVVIKALLFMLLGAVIAWIFVGLNPLEAKHGVVVIFFTGMIGISAMLLPGISGSFILLLLGQYEYMLEAIKAVRLSVVVPFMLGAGGGALAFSHILNYLLTHFRPQTMSLLVGIMLGALRLPYRRIAESGLPLYVVALPFLAGVGLVMGLERVSQSKK